MYLPGIELRYFLISAAADDRRDDVVVRVSASQLVDLGFIS